MKRKPTVREEKAARLAAYMRILTDVNDGVPPAGTKLLIENFTLAMQTLTGREEQILRIRYGLGREKWTHTYEEVAAFISQKPFVEMRRRPRMTWLQREHIRRNPPLVTVEEVIQLEKSAFEKLRNLGRQLYFYKEEKS